MRSFYKKIPFLLMLFGLSVFAQSSSGGAQKNIRLNLYGAYVFDDKFDASYTSGAYYNGKIKGGFQYGAGIDLEAAPGKHIELLWIAQSTTAPINYYSYGGGFDKSLNADVNLNYIMLGATNSFRKPGSKVEGFGGFMLGVGIVNADGTTTGVNPQTISGSSTKFAWGLKAGGIVWGSEKIGIKLQAQLLSLTQAMGGGVYFGTGGAGAGVSSYSTIYQLSLGGGLVFALGK